MLILFTIVRARRNLVGNTDATQSVISGTGVTSVDALATYDVIITARDSTSANRGIGGDFLWIRIENQCTKATRFHCVDVAGQKTVLQNEVSTLMADNLDGTYKYSYTPELDGTITISVFLLTYGGVYGEYFDSSTWSGTVVKTEYPTTLNVNWGTGALTTSRSDYVTASYYTAIRAPTTGTITIYIEVDDTAKVFIDDVVVINNGLGTFTATSNFLV